MRRLRTVTEALPTELGTHHGLAYSLWIPASEGPPAGAVVILHGANSCKESHHDFARALLPAGFASLAFDQRGHGASPGPMDARVIDDIVAMASVLRDRAGTDVPLALRGSSMGGFLSILAAKPTGASAVVAICPASAEGLRSGILSRRLDFDSDVQALGALLDTIDLPGVVESLGVPILILHAEGDEQVPVEHSRELERHLRVAGSRLITVPGGHHRSIQHDGEMQAVALRWLGRVLAADPAERTASA
jgi:uncharacterized protein